MAEHTPKPWEVTGPADPEWGLADTDFDFQEVYGSDGDLVALVAGKANTQVIVCTLELLEALEGFVRRAEALPHPTRAMWLKPSTQGMNDPCFTQAKAAIARVREGA